MFSVGTVLPPVPRSLALQIESGAFVKMLELSPEQLGTLCSEIPDKGTSKQRAVCNILEWIQCFWVVRCCSKKSQRGSQILLPMRLSSLKLIWNMKEMVG